MPITLRLPPPSVSLEIGLAANCAAELHTSLAMAWALQLHSVHCPSPARRPHWLDDAVRDINKLIELLKLEVEPEQPQSATDPVDPVDALFERAMMSALSGRGL